MNLYVLFVIIALFSFGITFLALDNIFIALGVMVLFALIGTLIFVPMITKHKNKVKRFHECYHFINNFVIALSIKKSIAGSLESVVNSMPTEFIEMYEGLEYMSDNEKINYLSTHFSFHIYRLFIQILELWEEEGGDILEMSKYLIAEARNSEEYITKSDSLSSHKYVEITVLWGFCLAIVVVLRFVLKDFFASVKHNVIYIVSIVLLMMLVLFSIYLLLSKGTDLKIKGYSENEKNV